MGHRCPAVRLRPPAGVVSRADARSEEPGRPTDDSSARPVSRATTVQQRRTLAARHACHTKPRAKESHESKSLPARASSWVWTLVADPILAAILAATFCHGSGGAAAIYAGLHEAWLVLRSAPCEGSITSTTAARTRVGRLRVTS